VKLVRDASATWATSERVCRERELAELIAVRDQEEQKAMEEIVLNRYVH
jgi:hypothetical protein